MTQNAAALRTLRIAHRVLLGVSVMYVFLGEQLHPAKPPENLSATFYICIEVLGLVFIAFTFFVKARLISSSENMVRQDPGNTAPLARWRMGYILAVLSEVIVLVWLRASEYWSDAAASGAILCGRHLPPADTQAAQSGVKYHRPRRGGPPATRKGQRSDSSFGKLLDSNRAQPPESATTVRRGAAGYAYGEAGAVRINEWGPAKLTSGGKVA